MSRHEEPVRHEAGGERIVYPGLASREYIPRTGLIYDALVEVENHESLLWEEIEDKAQPLREDAPRYQDYSGVRARLSLYRGGEAIIETRFYYEDGINSVFIHMDYRERNTAGWLAVEFYDDGAQAVRLSGKESRQEIPLEPSEETGKLFGCAHRLHETVANAGQT